MVDRLAHPRWERRAMQGRGRLPCAASARDDGVHRSTNAAAKGSLSGSFRVRVGGGRCLGCEPDPQARQVEWGCQATGWEPPSEGGANGTMRNVSAAQQDLDDLSDFDGSGPADVDLDDDRLHRANEPGRRERIGGAVVDLDLAHELGDVDALSYPVDSTNDRERTPIEDLRRALGKPIALSVWSQGARNTDDVAGPVNDAGNRRIARREPSPAHEAQPTVRTFRQGIE